MFDLQKYCDSELSLGNCVAVIPSLGIFSVDGVLVQEKVTFAHKGSIIGLKNILNKVTCDVPLKESDDVLEFIKNFDSRKTRDLAVALTGIDTTVFENSDLAVFSFSADNIKQCNSHQEELTLLKELSDRAFNALNVMRFIHCDLQTSDRLPYIPGYWNNSDGFMGACVLDPSGKSSLLAGRQMGGMISNGLGIGLEADETLGMEGHPFVLKLSREDSDVGEVGEMIAHALKVYNRAMYANNETLKFISIMALFEYLGTGDKYTNFKKVRPKLQAHIAKSREEYDRLSNIFQQYTSLKENDVNVGFRTRIIHEGALMEDIIPSISERAKLFCRLTNYVQCVIRGMYPHTSKSLAELQEHRNILLSKIGIAT